MATKQKEKTPLTKTEWTQSFTVVGKAVVNDYTYKIDEHSQNSDWVYNQLNLDIDCGDKYGKIRVELMGGYGSERSNNVVYVHGKNEDGTDDFKNSYQIAWEDRFDDSILEDIGDLCFYTVGLEKDVKNNTVYKKFLTPYDTIAYINEHLENDMVVIARGQLRYQVYNGNLQCKKEINSFSLSKAEPKDYRATFTQTMLIDKDSAGKHTVDLESKVMYVNAYLLEKFKEYNGWDLTDNGNVKGGIFVPLKKTFEYDLANKDPKATALLINKTFKVKKGVSKITVDGEFIESGATVNMTYDDLPDDIKEYVDAGIMDLEETLATCSTNGGRVRKMVIVKPHIKRVGDEDNKVPQIQIFPEVYTEEDLQLECLVPKNETDPEDEDVNEETVEDVSSEETDDLMALLNNLD